MQLPNDLRLVRMHLLALRADTMFLPLRVPHVRSYDLTEECLLDFGLTERAVHRCKMGNNPFKKFFGELR